MRSGNDPLLSVNDKLISDLIEYAQSLQNQIAREVIADFDQLDEDKKFNEIEKCLYFFDKDPNSVLTRDKKGYCEILLSVVQLRLILIDVQEKVATLQNESCKQDPDLKEIESLTEEIAELNQSVQYHLTNLNDKLLSSTQSLAITTLLTVTNFLGFLINVAASLVVSTLVGAGLSALAGPIVGGIGSAVAMLGTSFIVGYLDSRINKSIESTSINLMARYNQRHVDGRIQSRDQYATEQTQVPAKKAIQNQVENFSKCLRLNFFARSAQQVNDAQAKVSAKRKLG